VGLVSNLPSESAAWSEVERLRLNQQINQPSFQGRVTDNPHRFGYHNLRHSLASFLVRSKTDVKTVQALLRHSDVRTTLQLYAHSVSEDRLAAQGQVLSAILQQPITSAVN
jgi:site-specific recombinase XerD